MCRYQAASQACTIAAHRAEYTARNASKLAGGIEESNSQVVAEATDLIDEWVSIREGLDTAGEVMSVVAANPEAFEAFRRGLEGSTSRRGIQPRSITRAVGGSVADVIRLVRGR